MPKEEAAWITVAMPAAAASGQSNDGSLVGRTLSISCLEVQGSTNPTARFTSISAKPMLNRRRWTQTSSRASRQTTSLETRFFGAVAGAVTDKPTTAMARTLSLAGTGTREMRMPRGG